MKVNLRNLGFGFLGILLLIGGAILLYLSWYYPSSYFVSFSDNLPLLLLPYVLIFLGVIFILVGFGSSVEKGKETGEPLPPPPPPSLTINEKYPKHQKIVISFL